MNENREALDLLFESAEKAEQLVINRVFVHTNYWLLDEALYAIEKQLVVRSKQNYFETYSSSLSVFCI